MTDHDVNTAIESLMEICDCAACERLRRAERRKLIASVYEERIRQQLAEPLSDQRGRR